MWGPRGILRLRGLPARVRVRVGVGVRMGARLGAGCVLTLHIHAQPLMTRLLAARLATAVQDLLHELVYPGHLLMAGTLQGHLGRAGEKGKDVSKGLGPAGRPQS